MIEEKTPKKIKITNLLPILAILIIGLTSGTYAFYHSEIAQSLGINTAGYSVGVIERGEDGWGKREIYFYNNGTSPVLLRISYNEIWSKTINDQEITYNNLLNDETAVEKNWTEDFIKNFTLYEGWYYYTKTLKPNEQIQILKTIKLKEYDPTWDYDYRNLDYELAWNYESVQASSKATNTIWGIKASIEGDKVTWQF